MSANKSGLERRTAAELAALCLRHSRELNDFLLDLQRREDTAQMTIAKTIVGKIMGEMYVAAFYPIFEDYPDLKPPGFP